MLTVKIGLVKLALSSPSVNTLPPVAAAYQSIVSPAPAPVTLMFTVPGPQILSSTPTKLPVLGTLLTIAVTGILLELTHPVVLSLTSA